MSAFKYQNILLTGAAGTLGEQLRETLSKSCETLTVSDRISLKKKLESNKFTKPLFNTKLFTNHIEQAYLEMYKRYNNNQNPENIEIK